MLAHSAVESPRMREKTERERKRETMVHNGVLILGLIPVMLMAVTGGGEVRGMEPRNDLEM